MPGRIALVLLVVLTALPLAPLPAPGQTNPPSAVTSTGAAIPNRATVRSGTHRTRAQHRNTLNRQKARATAEHARRLQAGAQSVVERPQLRGLA
jgi:hypothetical protein